MILTADTSSTLDECGDGTGSQKGADADTEGIYTVSDRRVFEVQRDRIAEASEFSHGVQGTGCIYESVGVSSAAGTTVENRIPRMST